MLGVKDPGRTPMAWSIRPGFRGDLVFCDGGKIPGRGPVRVRAGYEPARRCTESCAACSVACLEVNMRGRETRPDAAVATAARLSLPETMLAKEAKIAEHSAVDNT